MKKWKRTDVLIAAGILTAALFFLLFQNFWRNQEADRAEVTVDGKFYGSYTLNENKRVKVEQSGQEYNLFEIQDASVKMLEASCPDRLCVHQKALTGPGEAIICLPNRVVIEIKAKKADSRAETDSVAG